VHAAEFVLLRAAVRRWRTRLWPPGKPASKTNRPVRDTHSPLEGDGFEPSRSRGRPRPSSPIPVFVRADFPVGEKSDKSDTKRSLKLHRVIELGAQAGCREALAGA